MTGVGVKLNARGVNNYLSERDSETPGGTYFITVNLRNRSSCYLVAHITHLRTAFREIRKQQPFELIAITILPEHLHNWEHEIRDDVDMQRHIDYIHYNPVKHGHVKRVVDWPYSSFHRYVRSGNFDKSWGNKVAIEMAYGCGE